MPPAYPPCSARARGGRRAGSRRPGRAGTPRSGPSHGRAGSREDRGRGVGRPLGRWRLPSGRRARRAGRTRARVTAWAEGPTARAADRLPGAARKGPVLPGGPRMARRELPPPGGRRTKLQAQVLEVLAGLEADGPSGRDLDLLARPRVAADAPLAWLDLEHSEAPQLDPLPLHQRVLHRLEDRFHGHL